eukprot:TRINITY_DN31927_c0_g1_i1.p1 TRINITY_DN31927_c0_g1~~TRINITY_DN31927_c0_g1_i1.p1  ORF type:complete len:292 (-),score=79.10 TRINITY_DN31927_c0_g1_i1:262-1137(-)
MSAPGKGKGDLDCVVLRHESGSKAEIYLFGATLCSYTTASGKECIFVSPGAIWDGKKAIRGGVPLVFPQFGQPDKAMAQHGFARSSVWTFESCEDTMEESIAILSLSDTEETRKVWNHKFRLEYVVTLTAVSLKMTLRVINTGEEDFKFMALLHTYFTIPEVSDAAVRGLVGREYIDKVDEGKTKQETSAHIELPSFTDRVYKAKYPRAKDVTIGTKAGACQYVTTQEATIAGEARPCDVVVWNPYEEASPGDLPPPAFKNFVCVEPGMVADYSTLPAKATAELTQKIVPV